MKARKPNTARRAMAQWGKLLPELLPFCSAAPLGVAEATAPLREDEDAADEADEADADLLEAADAEEADDADAIDAEDREASMELGKSVSGGRR
jgi:hypothetical protein